MQARVGQESAPRAPYMDGRQRTIGRYELLRADDWLTNPPESPLKALLRENQQVTELMTPGPGRSRMG